MAEMVCQLFVQLRFDGLEIATHHVRDAHIGEMGVETDFLKKLIGNGDGDVAHGGFSFHPLLCATEG